MCWTSRLQTDGSPPQTRATVSALPHPRVLSVTVVLRSTGAAAAGKQRNPRTDKDRRLTDWLRQMFHCENDASSGLQCRACWGSCETPLCPNGCCSVPRAAALKLWMCVPWALIAETSEGHCPQALTDDWLHRFVLHIFVFFGSTAVWSHTTMILCKTLSHHHVSFFNKRQNLVLGAFGALVLGSVALKAVAADVLPNLLPASRTQAHYCTSAIQPVLGISTTTFSY